MEATIDNTDPRDGLTPMPEYSNLHMETQELMSEVQRCINNHAALGENAYQIQSELQTADNELTTILERTEYSLAEKLRFRGRLQVILEDHAELRKKMEWYRRATLGEIAI